MEREHPHRLPGPGASPDPGRRAVDRRFGHRHVRSDRRDLRRRASSRTRPSSMPPAKQGTDPIDTYSRPDQGSPSWSHPRSRTVPTTPPSGGGTVGGTMGAPPVALTPMPVTSGDRRWLAPTDVVRTPAAAPWTPDGRPGDFLIAGRWLQLLGRLAPLWLAAGAARRVAARPRRARAEAPRPPRDCPLSPARCPLRRRGPRRPSRPRCPRPSRQRYKPGPGATDLLGVHGARVESHLGWHLGASLTYASNPLGFLDRRQDDFVYQAGGHPGDVGPAGLLLPLRPVRAGHGPAPHVPGLRAAAPPSPGLRGGRERRGPGGPAAVPKAHLLSSGGLDLGVAVPVLLPTAGGQGFRAARV